MDFLNNSDRHTSTLKLSVPTAAILISVALIFSTLNIFGVGFWKNTESLVIAFHLSSAFCTLSLLLISRENSNLFNEAIRHPFVVILGMIFVWSILVSAGSDFPLLSVLGPPQTGEGAIWYANFAVMTACSICIAQNYRYWRFITIFSACIIFAASLLKGLALLSNEVPPLISVNGYIAYFAITLPLFCLKLNGKKDRLITIFVILISIFTVLVSQNATAMAVFFFAAIGWVGIVYLKPRLPELRILRDRKIGAAIILICALLPGIFIYFGTFNTTSASLSSRHLITLAMENALGSDLYELGLGHGWGQTRDAILANATTVGESFLKPTWDVLWRNYIHSNNWLIEALYSTGLPGTILTLGLFIALSAYSARPFYPYAVIFGASYAILNSLWFQLAFSLPFVALALASVSETNYRNGVKSSGGVIPRLIAGCFVGLFVIQVCAGLGLLGFGLRVADAKESLTAPSKMNETWTFPRDFRSGENAFSSFVLSEIRNLSLLPVGTIASHEKVKIISNLLQELEVRVEGARSVDLVLAGNIVFSELHYNPSLARLLPAVPVKTNSWRKWVSRAMDVAPHRTDVLIPFFSNLLSEGNVSLLLELTQKILYQIPGDPIGNYYKGATLVVSSKYKDRQMGIKYLREGLIQGIERYMPIDPKLKKQILTKAQ